MCKYLCTPSIQAEYQRKHLTHYSAIITSRYGMKSPLFGKGLINAQSPGFMALLSVGSPLVRPFSEPWCGAIAETARRAASAQAMLPVDAFSLVVGRDLPITPGNSPASGSALPCSRAVCQSASAHSSMDCGGDDDDDDNLTDDDNVFDEGNTAMPTPPPSEVAFKIANTTTTSTTTTTTTLAGRSLRSGMRARRPRALGSPPEQNTTTTTQVPPRRTIGAAGKSSLVSRSAGAAVAKRDTGVIGGGVRQRPPNSSSMTVEERVLAIFGEEALRLDRDSFKEWRSATVLPSLTSSEQQTLKRLRRRLLGRTYAKRSRDRQVEHASHVESACDKLRKENASIRKKIERLHKLIESLERQQQHN